MNENGDGALERTVTSFGLEKSAEKPDPAGAVSDESETRVFSDLFCPICGGRFPGGLTTCTEDGVPLIPVGNGDDLSGTVLNNKYVLVQLIGRGGFGNVYRATHKLAKTEIAIKVIKDDLRDNDKAVRQFLKETRALMSIQSMHVVTVHDVDRDSDGRIFIVMELLRGRDLEDYVKAEHSSTNRMPWDEVARIVLQVCDALECAHEKGIVHRDLKPGNVMMVQGRGGVQKAKVVDFGIASLAQTGDMDLTTMDAVPRVIGTPSFMSPEQAKGQHVDSRADLYSLGAMIYRLVCGCKPFDSKTDQGMLIAHVIEKPKSIRERCPELDVPPEFDALVMQLMAKTPEERPATAAEVAARIEAILPEAGNTVEKKGGVAAWKIAVGVAAVLVLAAGAGFAWWFAQSGSRTVAATADAVVNDSAVAGQPVPAPTQAPAAATAVPVPATGTAPSTIPAAVASPVVAGSPAAASTGRPSVAPAPAASTASPASTAAAPAKASAPAGGSSQYIPTAPAAVPSVTTASGSGFQAPQVPSGQAGAGGQTGVKASPMKAAIPSGGRPGAPAVQPGPGTQPGGGTSAVSTPAAGAAGQPATKPAVAEPAKPKETPKQIESSDLSKDDFDDLDSMDGRSKKKAKKGTDKSDERRKADKHGDDAFDDLNF